MAWSWRRSAYGTTIPLWLRMTWLMLSSDESLPVELIGILQRQTKNPTQLLLISHTKLSVVPLEPVLSTRQQIFVYTNYWPWLLLISAPTPWEGRPEAFRKWVILNLQLSNLEKKDDEVLHNNVPIENTCLYCITVWTRKGKLYSYTWGEIPTYLLWLQTCLASLACCFSNFQF